MRRSGKTTIGFSVRAAMVLVAMLLAACGGGGSGGGGGDNSSAGSGGSGGSGGGDSTDNGGGGGPGSSGHITYTVGRQLYRIAAVEGAKPENISEKLAKIPGAGTGDDGWINCSPNGKWLLVSTGKFGFGDWAGLVIVNSEVSSYRLVLDDDGEPIHPDGGFSAITNDGNTVIYPNAGRTKLYAVTYNGTAWTKPVELTGNSSFQFHLMPAVSTDGTQVVFSCGSDTWGQTDTSMCRANTNGTGFSVVLPNTANNGNTNNTLYAPDFTPDDKSVVFEGQWSEEQVWKFALGGSPASALNLSAVKESGNDNSPVVLPDGSIASLWCNRPENGNGAHELKVMKADGSSYFMLLKNSDISDPNGISDIGMGAGE
jgi:hypothetical protein